MEVKEKTYSWSEIKLWRRCHKAHDYKYAQGLQRKVPASPLIRGVIFHELVDARVSGQDVQAVIDKYQKQYANLWDEQKEEYGSIDDIVSLYERYTAHYSGEKLEYLEINGRNSEIELKSEHDGIKFYSILDKVPQDENGLIWVMDHKCLDSNHRVHTNQGYVRMGDLTLEHRVISSEGRGIRIKELCHQTLQGFEIKLVGNRTLRATAEHRWPVMIGDRSDRLTFVMANTESLLTYPYTYLLPSAPILDYPTATLPLEPYLLGALIGDGSFTQGVRICAPEGEIISRVRGLLPDSSQATLVSVEGKADSYYLSGLRPIIKELGLFGKRSYEKHIPESYLMADLNQRMELLRGLMDTDGSVYKNSTYLYVTTSPHLVQDVMGLIQGLGGIPLIRSPKTSKYQGGKLGRKSYQIKFTLPLGVPFHLTRKIESVKLGKKRGLGSNLRVLDVTPVGDIPVTDISVDSSDSLFSVEGILTHNTHKVFPDEDARFSDLQTVLYYWQLQQNGVKAAGVLWDYVRTKPPAVVEVLKKGGLTRRVNLDTDYDTYMKAITDNGLDPRDYQEELDRARQNVYFKRVRLPHPPKVMVESVLTDFVNTAKEIESGNNQVRSLSKDCKMCSYYQLCHAEIRGHDADFLKKSLYTLRGERK